MIKIKLLFVFILMFFLSCQVSTDTDFDGTSIVAGNAKISGRIIIPENQNKDSIQITIGSVHPISAEIVNHQIPVDSSGNFSLDFEVETVTSYLIVYTNLNPSQVLFVKAKNNDSTNIELTYDSGLKIKNLEVTPSMNKYDMRQGPEVILNMLKYRRGGTNMAYPRFYDKSIEEFLDTAQSAVALRLEKFLKNDEIFSKEFKGFLEKDFRLEVYIAQVFDYDASMKQNFRNATGDTVNIPNIQKIVRTYFRFLKDFDLNDPQYLHIFTFPEFQNAILQNEVLGLPIIGEEDIPSWISKVKGLLSELVGFDKGQYYDILAANAYSRQLNEELKPLSIKQKEHILQYWKNGEIAKILFRKNDQVNELFKLKQPVIVNDISKVSDKNTLEVILSKYKNKVVLIDLWATWCGPCLEAMKQFRTTKGEFFDKDVAFVYLTNGTSPRNLWEEKIKGIGGEHYYLTNNQWKYLMNYFDLRYIPSYLIFDQEGDLINKFSGFPGNDKIKNVLEDLLKN